MKRYLSFAMALLLCLSALFIAVACTEVPDDPSSGNQGNQGNQGNEGNEGNGGNGGDSTDPNARLPIDYLPAEPFGTEAVPASYHMLQWTVSGATPGSGSSWTPWEEGYVEDLDGDILAEAVYSRNAAVEERYNVTITAEYGSVNQDPNFGTLLSTNHSSGDDRFQLMTIRALNLMSQVTSGYLLDMNTQSDYLHTDQPWWVEDAVVSYTQGDHLYACCTELLLRDKGATANMYFNQTLAADYDALPDFFELARNYEWTVEEMMLAAELVAHDADGSDNMDSEEDIWGVVSDDSTSLYMYNGFGLKFARVDEDGMLYAEISTGDTLTVLQSTIFENVMFADWFVNHNHVDETKFPNGSKMFVNGQALFTIGLLKGLTVSMRDMEDLYGVLPMPLLDEDQEAYSSLVYVHHDSVLGIPAAVKDASFAAVILEALSYEAYYTVSPVFYDAILLNRSAKEENSKEMIQLILDTRSYDPGMYWADSKGIVEQILRQPPANGTADVASLWASYGIAFEEDLKDVNELIAGKN